MKTGLEIADNIHEASSEILPRVRLVKERMKAKNQHMTLEFKIKMQTSVDAEIERVCEKRGLSPNHIKRVLEI